MGAVPNIADVVLRLRYGCLAAPSPKMGAKEKGYLRIRGPISQRRGLAILDGYLVMQRERQDSQSWQTARVLGRWRESWVKREYWIWRPPVADSQRDLTQEPWRGRPEVSGYRPIGQFR